MKIFTTSQKVHPPLEIMSGIVVPDNSDKPDPEQFKIQMRTVKASEEAGMRHNDYVGSYSSTGRVKLEKAKWAPKTKLEAGDNAFRADDWMGSGQTTSRKSWKVKSGDLKSEGEEQVHKWTPPPPDAAVRAPWESPPHPTSKTAPSPSRWQRKTPEAAPAKESMCTTAITTPEVKVQTEEFEKHFYDHPVLTNSDDKDDILGNTETPAKVSQNFKKLAISAGLQVTEQDETEAPAVVPRDDSSVEDLEVNSESEDSDDEEATFPLTVVEQKETKEETTIPVKNAPPDVKKESPSLSTADPEVEVLHAVISSPGRSVSDKSSSVDFEIASDNEEDDHGHDDVLLTTIGALKPTTLEVEEPAQLESQPISAPPPAMVHLNPSPQVGIMVGDSDAPDPEQFKIQMRTVQASADAGLRHDDFVGSYNKTGRIKLNKAKWEPKEKPVAGDNAFRADDWMGSGQGPRKSWKVKS